MGFIDSCEKYFGTKNLYELLNIQKTSTESEVKKAYRTLSLSVHPDRVPEGEKELATEKFKVLGKVYSILSDKDKRANYDEAGLIDDGDDGDFDERDWTAYWRCLFKEITMDDIINYEKAYKGSDDEIYDLKKAYKNGQGDMNFIFNHVPFVSLDDESRIRKIIMSLIEEGELEPYNEFLKEDPKKALRRKRKLEREAKEADELRKELEKKQNGKRNSDLEVNGNEDLMKVLMERKRDREMQADKFFEHLASKYGGGSPKSSKLKGNAKTRKSKN